MNAVTLIKSLLTKDKILNLLNSSNVRWSNTPDNGETFRCSCPLHSGSNVTAFVWNYINGLWNCFTGDCGYGDIFDFVADLNDMSVEHNFRDVIAKTAEVLGIDISNVEIGSKTDRHIKELNTWMEYVNHTQIKTNPEYDLRKIGNIFKLNSYRTYTTDTLAKFHIGYSENFKRIMIPLYNSANQCVGCSLRRTDETEEAKWIHRPKHVNTREIIYNLNNIPTERTVLFITEGPFDVMNMVQLGILNVGATMGAHLTDEQVDIIVSRFLTVILAYDGDDAGHKATLKAIDKLKNKVSLRIIDLRETPFHDLGEVDTLEGFKSIKTIKPYQYV